eukprot:gene811-20444_t
MVDLVNPLIGSGGTGWGAGSWNPGVQLPFGALRLGPDTSKGGLPPLELGRDALLPPNPSVAAHDGGYAYGDTHVRAFSHTHMAGAGVGDFGNVGVMPFCGEVTDAV